MKKVITKEQLRTIMTETINLLCNTVKTTLGPKGANAIIDHSTFSPFITNDGVTIASNIESEDPISNTILELAKEASIKTNEVAGDGTTTTLVLLQSLYNEGIKLIDQGINPLILKEKMIEKCQDIILSIQKNSQKPTKKDLLNIATISANDKEIGKLISQAYLSVSSKDAIIIKESNNPKTTLKFLKGYTLNTSISPIYFKNEQELSIDNPYILIMEDSFTIEDIAPIINDTIKQKANLIIITLDYDEQIQNEISSLYFNDGVSIILVKLEEYGLKGKIILDDLKALLNGEVFGQVLNMTLTKEYSTIAFSHNEYIKNKIKSLKKELIINNSIDQEFNNQRLSMLQKGLAFIYVGKTTITERREAKMRFDDALAAISSAVSGISLGCGLTYYQISEILDDNSIINHLFKKALQKPFEQIMDNSALNKNEIIKEIKRNNFTKIYNIKKDIYENANDTTVIDPTFVLVSALKNACSIAGMLLTTQTLIINEYQNNANKINDYNEL